ncbi:MAG: discoidin domain-containing protein, partial [Fibrobacterales bacterium]
MKKSIWITLLLSIVLSLTSLSAQVQRANLALGKPVTTNDTGPQHDPSKLVDGNSSTRWGSQMESDGPFHVIIDLEAPFLLDSIFLHWEAAFASSYTLHVSTDEEYWEKVATVENQSAN